MTVDEILAQREYLDRRGREWNLTDYWVDRATFDYVQMWLSPDCVATQDEMRLLIERDTHRDECKGIGGCIRHPVPHVLVYGPHEFWAFRRTGKFGALCSTHSGAMDAARALAVSSE